MREHFADPAEGRPLGGHEAVIDHLDFFTDDGQVEGREQVVHVVDRPGRRILDGEHSAIDVPGLYRVSDLLERVVAPVHDVPSQSPEVAGRRDVAVRSFRALVAHHEDLGR